MGRIVGIDLGTTYSAVAIPEERAGEGYFVLRDCPGYSVILDKLKRRIVPSVVAEDEQGQIVVGHAAKARAGLSPEPIMFAKRAMGEDQTFQLNQQGALRPEQVSAHILRHLKQLAEERLGEPVDEAVITVPAYFSMRAKQMTENAGELAGLRVAQIAQEPVAAALMYCVHDPRDPLRVMTYDLGGGTFDIAILEKRDGAISNDSIKAFDGDRFLGGYDFDKTLALWLMKQLVQQGYALQLNLDDPADKVIFAKLLVYAERAKIELSKRESYEFQEPATGITDHAGNVVTLDGIGLTRAQFEAMIRRQVEYSIELCHRARLEKATPPLERDQFDEILMVGGSSRIPLIARRLEEEFGRTPRLVEPDLCVALGAAIIAGTKPKTFGRLKLDPLPAETDLPSLTVTGQVVPGDGLGTVEGCAVTLRAADGSYTASRVTGAAGGFLFDGVALTPETPTEFVLTAKSAAGAEVAAHRFKVMRTERAQGGLVEPITNVLAKPIGILLEDGVHEIAPERTPLPYEKVVFAETRDVSGQIRVPILEAHNLLGEIVMSDLPTTLTVGSAVEITLTLQPDYKIRGRAYAPSVGREAKVVIDVPVPPRKSKEELRQEYEQLVGRADEALQLASRPEKFGGGKAKQLKDRQRDVEDLLQSQSPEPAAIQDKLDEIKGLIRDLNAGWRAEPPRAVFEQKASEAEDLLARAVQKRPRTAEEGYDQQLKAIRSEGDKAYAAQNTAGWKEAFERLVKLCDRLDELAAREEGGASQPQDPVLVLRALAQELATLEEWARENGRQAEFKGEFEALAAELKRIEPKAPDFMNQIRLWYFTKFEDLRKRIKAPEMTGILKLASQKGK